MSWKPIDLAKLQSLIARDLRSCDEAERELFDATRIEPERWRSTPWGDAGGGLWVVAIHHDRVVWFNDIEEGFNVASFRVRGEIPTEQYACNQDTLGEALRRLSGGIDRRFGPAEPIAE